MWLTPIELSALGLSRTGKNVLIDSRALILNPKKISIGDNSRIDAFAVISAGEESITIGKHVHISHSTRIYGSSGVEIHDFVGISSGVAIFTISDDYSSPVLNNPTVPNAFRKVKSGKVVIGRASLVGANSVILPGVSLGNGSSVGALSLVNKSVPDGWIVSGNPIRKISKRDPQDIDILINQYEINVRETK